MSDSRISRRERPLWQRRYWEHTIQDERDLENHINYIHLNPVKHGYVDDPFLWEFSSISKFAKDRENMLELGGRKEYELMEFDV